MIETERDEQPKGKYGSLPWFIDVFLYPTSLAGLWMLALLVVVPFLIDGLVMAMAHFLGVLAASFGFAADMIDLVILFYMFWYLGFCIRESAEGTFRAPDNLAPDFDDGVGETFWQTLLIVGTVAVCVAPAIVYYVKARHVDGYFWLALAGGGFFLPMAMLSVVMQNGFWGAQSRADHFFDSADVCAVSSCCSSVLCAYCDYRVFAYLLA